MGQRFAHYLFDWGDTLMVDCAGAREPMYLWGQVAAVAGARETLTDLHREAGCYLATNAQDSTEREIIRALERVGLAEHMDGVFCFENVGHRKPSPAFFKTILNITGAEPTQTVMVGDNLETDITGALEAGLHGIWYNLAGLPCRLDGVGVIHSLTELISPQR